MRAFTTSLIGITTLLFASVSSVAGLGSQCSAPVTAGTAAPGEPFWLENIKHQGKPAFNPNVTTEGYEVFRNVKDYGAVGDGVTDDTEAINLAFSDGDRCGNLTCGSTTNQPALVYFPSGTYRVSKSIQVYYESVMVGDARDMPVLVADKDFNFTVTTGVIDADPYALDGENWYVNQNSMWRSVRNFIIDLTEVPANVSATGLHWQVSQATSLMNIVVNMNSDPETAHQGLYMENGSGGYMGDLIMNGGKYGVLVGNQQFTVRNLTVNGAQSAVGTSWAWGWTFQGVTFNDCKIGFNLTVDGKDANFTGTGGEAIIDGYISNVDTFVSYSKASNGSLAGSLVINNIMLNNVTKGVSVTNGSTVLEGGSTTIEHWIQGNVYTGMNSNGTFVQASQPAPPKPGVLLNDKGHIVGKTHPQYIDYAVDQFVSVKDHGAIGDGYTDDTQAIQSVIDQFSGCKIIFFDQGAYLVTSTIRIPSGTQMVGETWTQIMGGGDFFGDILNPQPVIKAGEEWSEGVLEMTDFIFTTRGPAPGAIVLEWNIHDPSDQQAAAGVWDTHIRLGGALGTDITGDTGCGNSTAFNASCTAAFMGLHLTPGSSAYFEGTWIWAADHTLDYPYNSTQAYSGRGIYSESQGPVWLVGTAAEHHVLYQYNLVGASNHYIGLAQTEIPYYEPDPSVYEPFPLNPAYNDPIIYTNESMAWAMSISSSQDILVFGAGFYTFFDAWNGTCVNSVDCQTQMMNIESDSSAYVYSLSTVGTRYMLSVDDMGVVESGSNDVGFSDTMSAWVPW